MGLITGKETLNLARERIRQQMEQIGDLEAVAVAMDLDPKAFEEIANQIIETRALVEAGGTGIGDESVPLLGLLIGVEAGRMSVQAPVAEDLLNKNFDCIKEAAQAIHHAGMDAYLAAAKMFEDSFKAMAPPHWEKELDKQEAARKELEGVDDGE